MNIIKYVKVAPWIIICFLAFYVSYLHKTNTILGDQTATLSAQLSSKIVVSQNKLVYVYRDRGGATKQKTEYIPVAGSVQIIQSSDTVHGAAVSPSILPKPQIFYTQIPTDNGILLIKNKGFTFLPEASVLYGPQGVEAALGAQVAYWNRYAAIVGVTHRSSLYLGMERNISDIVPFTHNTNVVLGVGRNVQKQDWRVLGGLSWAL